MREANILLLLFYPKWHDKKTDRDDSCDYLRFLSLMTLSYAEGVFLFMQESPYPRSSHLNR